MSIIQIYLDYILFML